MSKATTQINKVKLSDLKNLEFEETIELENDILPYGFTKLEIMDCDYLIFGSRGFYSSIIAMALDDEIADYKDFQEKINSKYDINLEILFDK